MKKPVNKTVLEQIQEKLAEDIAKQEAVILNEEKDKEKDKEKDEEKDKDKDDMDESIDVSKTLTDILSKVDLPEGIAEELGTLFVACVSEAVNEKIKTIDEAKTEEFAVVVDELKEGFNTYITYVGEEWMKENTVAVESGIKLEIAENFLSGMKSLFTENYIEVPEDKVDIIEETEEVLEEMKSELDESRNQTIELKKQLDEMKKDKIVDELTCEMADTDKEKLSGLVDSVEYSNDDEYRSKVSIVIENFFDKSPADKKKKIIKESNENDDISDRMAMYV